MRSATSVTMSRLCSIRQTVTPSAVAARSSPTKCARDGGSRPEAGSSSSQMRAPVAMMRAIDRNLRSA